MADKQNLQPTPVIAKLFGISERQVQQLAKEGSIPFESSRPYQFDLLPTVKGYIKYLTDMVNNRAKDPEVADDEARKIKAEADFKAERAMMAAMQRQEMEASLFPAEDVESEWNNLIYAVRSTMLCVPGMVAVNLAQMYPGMNANQGAEVVRKEIKRALGELADFYKFDPDEYLRRIKDRLGFDSSLLSDEDE